MERCSRRTPESKKESPEALRHARADGLRVQIYNGLVPSGFARIGTRVALELPDDHLAAASAECIGGETRRYGSSTGFPRRDRPEPGRFSSTWRPSDSTA